MYALVLGSAGVHPVVTVTYIHVHACRDCGGFVFSPSYFHLMIEFMAQYIVNTCC